MMIKLVALGLLIGLSTPAPGQDDAPPDLGQVMEEVRGHVERLETSVPNFICKEQIVSQLYFDDKVDKQTKAEAVLTTTRVRRQDHNQFVESRADMKINGKRTKRNEIAGPFVWHGGPAYGDLHFLFNSNRGELCLDRRMVGPVKLGDKQALLVETHASPAVGSDPDCRELKASSGDRIWLDAQTRNVIRVESHNPPATRVPGADLTLTVDYAPAVFDGEEYWLPSHFISRLDFPGLEKHLQYEAWFSDYHKFGAESVIRIDSNQ